MWTEIGRIFTVICLFTLISYGQDAEAVEQPDLKIPIKIDEFGQLYECDLGARIDNLFIRLNSDQSTEGFIITYRGEDQLPASYQSDAMKTGISRMIKFAKFDASRITFIDGGFREERSAEFFLAHRGVQAPQPTNTVPAPKTPVRKTFLFDRSYLNTEDTAEFMEGFTLPSVKTRIDEEIKNFQNENENENESPAVEQQLSEVQAEMTAVEEPGLTPEEAESLHFMWANDAFGEQIKKRKNSKGLMIYYADDQYYDTGNLYSLINEGKRRIALANDLSPDKIEIFYGGYRSDIQVEYWIIPKDGEFPKATPEGRPVEEIEK